MVMDGEERDGGGETAEDVIQAVESVIQSAASFGEYRRTQRKECYNLLRRMRLLLPLFEEVRELESPVTDKGIDWMLELKKVLVMAKKLLKFCYKSEIMVMEFIETILCLFI